jgi:hypothetical protein
MHTNTLLSLLTLAFTIPVSTAIDIRLHANSNCGGNALICSAINPTVCCNSSQGFWSIDFYGVPSNWNIRGSVYIDSTCSDALLSGNNNGNTFMCFNAPQAIYHSAKYAFNGRKREIVREGCQTPDTFLLESGVEYDVSGMEEGVLAELIDTAETSGEGDLRRFDEYMKSG